MILDIFSELQKPSGMPEPQLYDEALAQAKLADELGFGCWWSAEHHCTGNFSHCSTPDLMLTVISQHTEQIHLGHSGVLAPYGIHHPLQVAERAAFLDVVSGGRVELGLARSVAREWETFRIDIEATRDQVDEALRIIPLMWTEDRFSHEGQVSIPERNVVPKPLQRPHPPLWVKAALFDNRSKILGFGESQPHVELDFDHPVPLIALMNRQLAGQKLDPVEAYEVLEPIDAAIIGDVETCRRKLERFAGIGVDRLMCLMQMAPLPHEVVMRSIRTAGKYLIPELRAGDRSSS